MAATAPATAGELLRIDPLELRFPFELKKQISCSMQLSNLSDDYIAFKVKTTSPKKYSVRPNTGVVLPRSTCDVVVTMQAQREAPADMQCKDKFLVQSVVAPPGITVKDVTGDMFTKESGSKMEEVKLRVTYVAPPQPPSPVPEESEEGSPSRVSESENGDGSAGGFTRALRERIEPQEKSFEAGALISKLTEEKNSAIQQNHRLRQELDLVRREISKRRGRGFSFIVVIIVAFIGIFLGYLMKS
ncbi:vesicle-associated protein 1-2-like [Phragmites australis]|uniref:vesicle-associated protein 1-2-like n=1 Tax=Phragmites australis TaxID=29695 RepID=UPI002D796DBB|nr:vesicle-associated protein 1-2-like [Phragmites australis]